MIKTPYITYYVPFTVLLVYICYDIDDMYNIILFHRLV